jgi:peptidylprolyl isomerase
MKQLVLAYFLAACTSAAIAQAAPKASTASQPATAKPATATTSTASSSTAVPPWIKLPAGIPKVVHGPVKTSIALHYEDIKVGTGALGESGKMWHIKYTGWRASDGVMFDSWDEHKVPVYGKDGKPELDADGKTKMGDPQPMAFPQGVGRLIPGFDYGVEGMRIGGKRRVFIPWQFAYGTRNIPDRPDHPGIPAKSDLIFDVELVDVTDMPAPPQRPVMPIRPGAPGAAPGTAPGSGPGTAPGSAPGNPAAPGNAPKPGTPSTPGTPTTPQATATPSTQSQPATQPATQPSTQAQPSTGSQPQ